MSGSRRLAIQAASLCLLVLVWQVVATLLDDRVLPTPGTVFDTMAAATLSGALPYNVGVTLLRVAASFALAMSLGMALGIALGRMTLLDRFLDPWVFLFLNLPALVTIILCYVWFGLTEVAAVVAVAINKIPTVAVMLREGTRALDRDLEEMARVFAFGRVRTLRHVVLPQLTPHTMAAARTGLALIWKIVLVVELLGRSNGVGFQLGLFFSLFDVAGILAYALAFILVVQAIEIGLVQPLERRLDRWRR